MANPVNNRDVRKKEISKSFRGILRVSPDDEGSDNGINEHPLPIYDSVGNMSALSIGTESIFVEKEVVSDAQLRDKITFGTNSDVPVSPPQNEEVLLGNNSGDYIQYNLRQFLDEYFASNLILEQLVPVGTIIYTALGDEDLNRLPTKYHGWYDFCRGQSSNSQTNLAYDGTNYPDLCRVLTGNTTGSFTLPDLRNRYIRSTSNISHQIVDEGDYTIPIHSAFTLENPQTNPFIIKDALETTAVGEFRSLVEINNTPGYASGCVSVKPGSLIKYESCAWKWKYALYTGIFKINLIRDGASLESKETRPYSISLVPLIKVK